MDRISGKGGGLVEEMHARIEKALDQVRPAIRMDGGDVELVEIEDGIVKVRLMGACGG